MPSTSVSNNLTQSLWHRYAEQLCSTKNAPSHRAEASSLTGLITFPVLHVTEPWEHGIPQSRAALAECRPPRFPALCAHVGLRLPRLLWAPSCRPAASCAGLTAPSESTRAHTCSQQACGRDAELRVAVALHGLRGCRVHRLAAISLASPFPVTACRSPVRLWSCPGFSRLSGPSGLLNLCVEIFHTLENCHLLSLQK